jgi:hypothetical protein
MKKNLSKPVSELLLRWQDSSVFCKECPSNKWGFFLSKALEEELVTAISFLSLGNWPASNSTTDALLKVFQSCKSEEQICTLLILCCSYLQPGVSLKPLGSYIAAGYLRLGDYQRKWFRDNGVESLSTEFISRVEVLEEFSDEWSSSQFRSESESFVSPVFFYLRDDQNFFQSVFQYWRGYLHPGSREKKLYKTYKKRYPQYCDFLEQKGFHCFSGIFANMSEKDKAEIESQYLHILASLEADGRDRFLLRFAGSMLLTILLTWYFEPDWLLFWIIAGILGGVFDWYSAWKCPNRLFYYYRLRIKLLKKFQKVDILVLPLAGLSGLNEKLPNNYQKKLWTLISKDSWFSLPFSESVS